MGYCPNCKTRLTCGCQKRVSTKGVAGCANCITQLNGATPPPQQQQTAIAPVPAPVKAPTNVVGTFKGPGTQI
jgi:hypothetical protein